MLDCVHNDVLHLRNLQVSPLMLSSSLLPFLLISLIATLGFQGQTGFHVGRSAILPHSGGTSVLQQVQVSRKQDDSQLGGQSASWKCFWFRKWYFFTERDVPGQSETLVICHVVLCRTCSGKCVWLAWWGSACRKPLLAGWWNPSSCGNHSHFELQSLIWMFQPLSNYVGASYCPSIKPASFQVFSFKKTKKDIGYWY